MPRVHVGKITKNIYVIRVDDQDTVYFEALWRIPEGITYNSYVITLPDKTLVLDTWKQRYSDLYIETLKQIVDPNSVDYIIVHHTEPDHSGSLKKLVEYSRRAVIVGHQIAGELVKSFYGIGSVFKPVKDGEMLELGGDHRLVFYHTPWLHWPDTIISYFETDRVLFTCDIFGSYGIPSAIFYDDLPESEKERFRWYMQKYFANVIGKYVDWVNKNLEKINSLNLSLSIIAPAHGPLYRDIRYPIELYRQFGSKKPSRGKTVVVYSSMYGFIGEAVDLVVKALRDRGIEPKIYRFTDDHRDYESDLIGDLFDAEYIIVATSTYDADAFPLMKYIIDLVKAKIPGGRRILILGNYGWGPVAGRMIKEALESKGHVVVDLVEIKGSALSNEQRILEAVRKLLS